MNFRRQRVRHDPFDFSKDPTDEGEALVKWMKWWGPVCFAFAIMILFSGFLFAWKAGPLLLKILEKAAYGCA